jgi:hypothetical protein
LQRLWFPGSIKTVTEDVEGLEGPQRSPRRPLPTTTFHAEATQTHESQEASRVTKKRSSPSTYPIKAENWTALGRWSGNLASRRSTGSILRILAASGAACSRINRTLRFMCMRMAVRSRKVSLRTAGNGTTPTVTSAENPWLYIYIYLITKYLELRGELALRRA